jgi:hypothetical protein
MDTMLSKALREFMTGPLKQLIVNLGGENGSLVEEELKKFNRGEPCWVKAEEVVQQAQTAATEIAKRALTAFKTLKIGGIPKKELASKVAKSCEEVTDWAKDLMKQKAFVTADAQTDVDFVVLSIADLGFISSPRTDAFMTKEFCKEWSEKFLDGQAIELCEPEDGPQLRIQYEDQPNGEVLWMAMERIADSGGNPSVFCVERDGGGGRWLDAGWVNPSGTWRLGRRFVFRLRKLPQPLAA